MCYGEEWKNDNPLVLDVSELALDPTSWTICVVFGTFEHLVGGELQLPAKIWGMYIA